MEDKIHEKIALLVALALIVSVGGVYATWRYSTEAVSSFDFDFSNSLAITVVDGTGGAKGFISAPNTLVLTIDDDDGDHKPDWDADVAGAEGSLTVKFTPNTGASAATLKYDITVSNFSYHCPTHGDVSVFAPVDTDGDPGNDYQIISDELVYTGGPEAVTAVISADTIQDALHLNETITLDSIDEYNSFKTAVGNVELVLHVEEVVAP